MRGSWVRITLFYLVVTALSGLFMRGMGMSLGSVRLPIVPYDHVLHAHSHLALLGWVYMALFLLLLTHFCDREQPLSRQVRLMYGITQFTLAGMFAAFLVQGYAIASIALSTLQILLSYWFVWWLWRQLSKQQRSAPTGAPGPLSLRIAKGSLICLTASSLGPWTLAVLSAKQLQESPLYEAAIYFYLHLQYNGWFTLALAAIVVRLLEKRNIVFSHQLVDAFYRLYVWSLLPAYLLSVLWAVPGSGLHFVAAAAAICQWVAALLLLIALHRVRTDIFRLFKGGSLLLLLIALAIFFMKSTLELGPVIPSLSDWIYGSRSVVIGYLHLTLLGFVSLFCLALFLEQGWLDGSKHGIRIGLTAFLSGFAMNEFVLFLQGLYDLLDLGYVRHLERWLLLASAGMAAGLLIIWCMGGVAGWKTQSSTSSLSAAE
jgi:hypothetical protein